MLVKVLYQAAPFWRVGEERELKPDLVVLAQSYIALADADRYPDDYAGRVISVVPESHEFTPGDVADPRRRVIALDLTDEEHADVGSRRLKVGPFGLEPVTFQDRWGAVGARLAEEFGEELDIFAGCTGEDNPLGRRFDQAGADLRRALPKVAVHSGAGLYEVGSGKTYSTIQSALDQLWTDQGSATFTASQYIRIFAGTYDEVVVANAAFDPDKTNGFLLVIEGDPADDRTNIVVTYTPAYTTSVITSSCDHTIVRHLKVVCPAAYATYGIYGWVGVVAFDVHDCVVETGNVNSRGVYIWQTLRLSNTTITSALGHGVEVGFARDSSVLNCSITAARQLVNMGGGDVTVEGCVLSGGSNGASVNLTPNSVARKIRLSNNTIYGHSAAGLSLAAGIYPALMDVELVNNIFKDCAAVIKVATAVWPEESSTRYGPSFTMRNNCYHGYTNFATDGSDDKTHSQFTAYGRVDASGDLDATDPLLTNPGAGDFSLQTSSPCKWAGHGSGVVKGQNAVAYDPNHPDIGGWSSGTLTVAAPAIASVIKLSTSSARLSMHAGNVSDVLSVRYRLGWGEEWTLFGSTRTGSGTLDVTGLAFGTYTFLATAARGGEISLPSNAARVSITEDGIASPGEAVYALLRANSTLAALVGDHIYAQGASEAAPPPYVTVVRIGGTPEHTLAASAGFAEARFQIESYGATLEDAQSVADAVRNSLDGYRGTVTVGSAEVAVGSIRRDSDSDGFTQPTSAGGIGRHRVVQDYLMTHEESVPVFP